MIPGLVNTGGPFAFLPPGIHDATLDEIEAVFATTPHRKALFEGFKAGVESLRQAGCRIIYLDGSFVSDKERPGDFDACWDPIGVDDSKLDPTLLDFKDMRKNQKKHFGGEFFFSSEAAAHGISFLAYFQNDKHTGKPKGIIRLSIPSN